MITAIQKMNKEKRERHMGIGITMESTRNLGDRLQFSSLPENFFRITGQKLIDVSKPWFFDHNPYVLRDQEPRRKVELWNFPKKYEWPKPRQSVYLSNAELHCAVMGLENPPLNRPRLYKFEDYYFDKRDRILLHPFGISHGQMPDHVLKHVIDKYKATGTLFQIGLPTDPDIGIKRIVTSTLWDLAEVISKARMYIGVDSGPAWIAACYPDVVIKKLRTKFQGGYCEPKDWVPLDVKNYDSHWDDQSLFKIYNCFEDDVGFTSSYRKI
jgi:hypothetical protein